MNRIILLIMLLITSQDGIAQVLKGVVLDGVTGEPLKTVNIYNATRHQYAYSDEEGNFSLTAFKGDLITFSSIGYRSQQKTVPSSMGVAEMHIDLFPLSYELDEVEFRPLYTPYQLDSMERKDIYQRPLARQKVRSIMSPVTLLADKLSRKSKQIYKFQKTFHYWEDLKFIESRYTPALVESMTPLRGDTVAAFMNAHPLPVDFARVASDLELKMWIREQYRIWQRNPQYLPPSVGNDTLRTTE